MDKIEAILIYRFNDAPKEWRDVLNDNGGDEDWLAVIPPCYRDEWIPWLEYSGSFGVCCTNWYEVDENGVVRRVCDRDDEEGYVVGTIEYLAGSKIAVGCHA